MDDILRRRVVCEAAAGSTVEIVRDLPYASRAAALLDIYRPAGRDTVPIVMLVHGGPISAHLRPNDWGIFKSYGELLAAEGVGAVMFTHRLFGTAVLDGRVLEDASQDLDRALAYVSEIAPRHRLDPTRVAFWAFSGGGLLLTPTIRHPPASVRCVVAYYAALDLVPLRNPAGSTLSEEEARRLSPAHEIACAAAPQPPWLIARAGRDRPALNGGIDLAVSALLDANAPLDLLTLPDGEHGFDVLNDQDRSREVIRRTIAFVRSRLGLQAPREVSSGA